MKRHRNLILLPLLLTGLVLFGCSKKETPKKKGAVDRLTDRTASNLVHRIKDPIEDARAAAARAAETREIPPDLPK